MMKKKTAKKGLGEKGADKSKNIEDTLKEIKSKFGDESIMKLGESSKVDVEAISTGSLGLDFALGIGGLPRGRVIEIYGPESSGKTTLALHVVAEAQKKGGIGAFVDAEHAMDPEYAGKLGVNTDELLISQPDTGEQALEITESLVRSGKIDVVVIDSVAALTPKDEIEGDMGAYHVGKQARLMSQALRKLTAIVARSKTIVIFINQIRMKIGVMFGCLNYKSKVTLANGTQEWIGKIVNQKMDVEVLSYDWKKNKIVPAKIEGWYKNGIADKFLQIHAYNPAGNGRSQFACTTNHPVLTPTGYRRAEDLKVGDKIMINTVKRLSDFQMEVIRGTLMGDSALSPNRKSSYGIRYRMGHGLKQKPYLKWKAQLFKNIDKTIYENERAIFCDLTPLPELYELRKVMYRKGGKYLTPDFLAKMTPLSLALWYQDDGSLQIRNKAKDKGRIVINIQAIHPESRPMVRSLLKERYDIRNKIVKVSGQHRLVFDQSNTDKFLKVIRNYVHPSMAYKLLPQHKDRFHIEPKFIEAELKPMAVPIIEIKDKPKTRSMHRFDIKIKDHHNFLADNVIVHNSPETTPGGRALKFYTSVRIDVRRIAQIKKGEEVIGSRTRAKVVKNKVASPFKQAEFDLVHNEGISKEGEMLVLGEKFGLIEKSGAYYKYDGEKIGQGYDATRLAVKENKKLSNKLEKEIVKALKGADKKLD